MLDVSNLETWLWDAACEIRGPLDAPKFKDYILPLVFLKRLSDVFDDEVDGLATEFGSRDDGHWSWLTRTARPSGSTSRRRPAGRPSPRTPPGWAKHLTDAVRAVARENPRAQGVIDVVDFNATTAGQRIVDDQRLAALVQVSHATASA